MSHWFLRVETQPEVGEDGYDAGAAILTDFFHQQLTAFLNDADLNPLGKKIIQACLDGASVEQYAGLLS